MELKDKKHILFIEDSEALCNIYTHILKEAGYCLITTSNRKEVLEILNRKRIDIIICDYFLPETDGIQLIRLVREIEKNAYCILFTSAFKVDIETSALTNGFDDIISKPCEKSRLFLSIQKGEKIVKQRILSKQIGEYVSKLSQITQELSLYN